MANLVKLDHIKNKWYDIRIIQRSFIWIDILD